MVANAFGNRLFHTAIPLGICTQNKLNKVVTIIHILPEKVASTSNITFFLEIMGVDKINMNEFVILFDCVLCRLIGIIAYSDL